MFHVWQVAAVAFCRNGGRAEGGQTEIGVRNPPRQSSRVGVLLEEGPVQGCQAGTLGPRSSRTPTTMRSLWC